MDSIISEIHALRKNSALAYVASVDEAGFPKVKGMLVLEREGLIVQYFSAGTTARLMSQFQNNTRASVYYCDEAKHKGVLFAGIMEICTDKNIKARLWQPALEELYPGGIDDEDYYVLKFTANAVNYYHGSENVTIPISLL